MRLILIRNWPRSRQEEVPRLLRAFGMTEGVGLLFLLFFGGFHRLAAFFGALGVILLRRITPLARSDADKYCSGPFTITGALLQLEDVDDKRPSGAGNEFQLGNRPPIREDQGELLRLGQ